MGKVARGRWQGARGPGRAFAVCLAVLAILAQNVLFEHAMAAAKVAAAQARAEREHAHAHGHHGGAPNEPKQAPHQHGEDCPFCLARAMHQGLSLAAGPVLLRLAVVGVTSPLPRGRVRVARRSARVRCRSPPLRS